MGCATTFDDFKQAFTKTKFVALGFLLQCILMPLLAYVLVLIFQLPNTVAVGAILVGAAPGGTTSNLFTYWSKGDLALSITLSCLSSMASFGFYPFWSWLLIEVALQSSVVIDWMGMVEALLSVVIPIFVGLLLRRFNKKCKVCGKFIWRWVELFASVAGAIFLLGLIVVSIFAYGNIFLDMEWNTWVSSALLQPIGSLFGYFTTKLFRGSPKLRRTICIEVGINAFAMATAVITLSFYQIQYLHYAMQFAIGYGLFFFVYSLSITAFFRFYLAKKDPEEEEDTKTVETTDEEVEDGSLTRSLLQD